MLDRLEAGTFSALKSIHIAPLMYLEVSLANIDKMPQSTFDEIVEKYVEEL